MKTLIPILIGLLVVGCGKKEASEPIAIKPSSDVIATTQKGRLASRELGAVEMNMVGEYEREDEFGDTYKYIFLENGVVEEYENGKEGPRQHGSLLHPPLKWGINKKGELYIIYEINGDSWIYSINEDRSITYIAYTQSRRRTERKIEHRWTYKRIKHNAAKDLKALKKEDVIGTYQGMKYGSTYKLVLLESGVAEAYTYGKNGKIEDIQKAKWKLAAGEIFSYDEGTGGGRIFRINKDDSLTRIARTGKGGKREDYPKEEQEAWRRIK